MHFGPDETGRVLRAVVERLPGDWLLVGGALVGCWLDEARRTQDVDLVGPTGTREERLALLDLADELGLSIEALNSAADFFVRRIQGWEGQTRVLLTGRAGRVLRPTVTLFLLTKLRRLSEVDLADCLAAIAWARDRPDELDRARVIRAVDELAATADEDRAARRADLRSALAGS